MRNFFSTIWNFLTVVAVVVVVCLFVWFVFLPGIALSSLDPSLIRFLG